MAAAGMEAEPTASNAMLAFEAALAAQRKFMGRYGSQLEEILTMLVYLVPVQDAEDDRAGFQSQAVYSVIDLFGMYRTALMRSPDALPVTAPEPGAASNSALLGARIRYTLAAFVLRALRSVQVLAEMKAARSRGGIQHTLHVCMRIEAVKLLLKLWLKKQTPFSFYIDEAVLEEIEPPSVSLAAGAALPAPGAAPSGGSGGEDAHVGRRTGRTLPALGARSESAGSPFGLTRSLASFAADRSPASLGARLAEVLFHGRPFLHLAMLARHGQRSWAAWWAALLVDWISLNLLTFAARPRPDSRAASLELAELRRRRQLLCWALARSPAFDKVFRRPCEFLDRVLKRIPIVNMFNVVELGLALQPFYFTSAAS